MSEQLIKFTDHDRFYTVFIDKRFPFVPPTLIHSYKGPFDIDNTGAFFNLDIFTRHMQEYWSPFHTIKTIVDAFERKSTKLYAPREHVRNNNLEDYSDDIITHPITGELVSKSDYPYC